MPVSWQTRPEAVGGGGRRRGVGFFQVVEKVDGGGGSLLPFLPSHVHLSQSHAHASACVLTCRGVWGRERGRQSQPVTRPRRRRPSDDGRAFPRPLSSPPARIPTRSAPLPHRPLPNSPSQRRGAPRAGATGASDSADRRGASAAPAANDDRVPRREARDTAGLSAACMVVCVWIGEARPDHKIKREEVLRGVVPTSHSLVVFFPLSPLSIVTTASTLAPPRPSGTMLRAAVMAVKTGECELWGRGGTPKRASAPLAFAIGAPCPPRVSTATGGNGLHQCSVSRLVQVGMKKTRPDFGEEVTANRRSTVLLTETHTPTFHTQPRAAACPWPRSDPPHRQRPLCVPWLRRQPQQTAAAPSLAAIRHPALRSPRRPRSGAPRLSPPSPSPPPPTRMPPGRGTVGRRLPWLRQRHKRR